MLAVRLADRPVRPATGMASSLGDARPDATATAARYDLAESGSSCQAGTQTLRATAASAIGSDDSTARASIAPSGAPAIRQIVCPRI